MSRLIVYALAVFRVTHLLAAERGPFDVFDWLRAKAGVYYRFELGQQGQQPTYIREADGFWGELMNCPLCLSGWVAAPVMIGYLLKSKLLDAVASWLAIWGLVVALFKIVGYDE
jgi:hypothetical protein